MCSMQPGLGTCEARQKQGEERVFFTLAQEVLESLLTELLHMQEERYAVHICSHKLKAARLQLGPLTARPQHSGLRDRQQQDAVVQSPPTAAQPAHPLLDVPLADRLQQIEAQVNCMHWQLPEEKSSSATEF